MNSTPDDLEVSDPIAHPHYPARPARAANPVYTVVSEPLLDDDKENTAANDQSFSARAA